MTAGVSYIGVGVGAMIIDDQGRLLLGLRGPAAKNERGKWEIPGGAVEFGETFEQAIVREAQEEIGVTIKVIKLLKLNDHILPDEGQHWVSPSYLCRIVSGEPQIMEPTKSTRLEWFSIEEAAQLPLAMVTKEDITFLQEHPEVLP